MDNSRVWRRCRRRITHVHGAGAVGAVGEGEGEVVDVTGHRGGVGARHHVTIGRQVLSRGRCGVMAAKGISKR